MHISIIERYLASIPVHAKNRTMSDEVKYSIFSRGLLPIGVNLKSKLQVL